MNLFEESNNTSGSTAAPKTVSEKLTHEAAALAHKMYEVITAEDSDYEAQIIASKTDNNALDALVNELVSISEVPVDLFIGLEKDQINNMLKSQQSKRSRCRAQAMTVENYKKMLTAAIAELIIRAELGTPKSASRTGVRRSTQELTEEYLTSLETDTEELKRALRNVQSKKSILKKKGAIDEGQENYDKWLALCADEEAIKARRGDAPTQVKIITVDETKNRLVDILDGVDTNKLKLADSKELLRQIRVLVATDEEELEESEE